MIGYYLEVPEREDAERLEEVLHNVVNLDPPIFGLTFEKCFQPNTRYQLAGLLQAGLNEKELENIGKQLSKVISEVSYEFQDRIQSDMSYNLSYWVHKMAEDAIEDLLKGDEEAFRRHLSCLENGYTGRDREHLVIHGKLFEADCIELRKEICKVNENIFTNERILDLESQVSSLVKQLNVKEDQLERLRRDQRDGY